jgi:hypothetical protein
MIARGIVLALVGLAVGGCKDSAKKRATEAVQAPTFWPEAPKATKPSGTRSFRYKPENIAGFSMTAEGGTAPGSEGKLDFTMTMTVRLGAGKTPRERDASIEKLELTADVMTTRMKMRLDHDEMFVEQNGEPVSFKRGDDGPIDVAGMTDKPFTTFVFDENNEVHLRAIADHPLNTLGGAGDMLDSALLLYPDLPKQAVPAGHKWTVKRRTPVGATGTFVDVTYDYEYTGDSACPSGATTCSLFTFSAASKDVAVQSEGVAMTASYGFAGKVFFDHERGTVDESRVRMDLDAKAEGMRLPIAATFIVKPTR